MKKTKILSMGLLVALILVSMGCGTLEPKIDIVQTEKNTVVTVYSMPAPLNIEITVPLTELNGETHRRSGRCYCRSVGYSTGRHSYCRARKNG